jgi:hypothetical protein
VRIIFVVYFLYLEWDAFGLLITNSVAPHEQSLLLICLEQLSVPPPLTPQICVSICGARVDSYCCLRAHHRAATRKGKKTSSNFILSIFFSFSLYLCLD